MQEVAKEQASEAIPEPRLLKVGELFVPRVAYGAMDVTHVRLIGSRKDAPRERCGGRNDGIEAGYVELLDQKRTGEEQGAIELVYERQPVGDRGVKWHICEILLLDLLWEEVE